ncbi:MAG: PaaI family thioesterase [Flavobacteriia bacterium]|jgi:1,4-dihydroxy-2-naphthoyl-CoA hydrolase|nr:PaaI family thioesterase [Flavobacteriia bacterium]
MKLKNVPLELINSKSNNTLVTTLGIECIEIGENFIVLKMPVDRRTHQPMGILHGGASAALIETVGSMGSTLLIDLEKEVPVGLEINCNHVRSVKSGFVLATGTLVHCGRRTHVWQVNIHEEGTKRLICTGRLTVMIIEKEA